MCSLQICPVVQKGSSLLWWLLEVYIKDILIKYKKLMHSYIHQFRKGSGTGPFGNFKANLELKSQVGQYQNKFNS